MALRLSEGLGRTFRISTPVAAVTLTLLGCAGGPPVEERSQLSATQVCCEHYRQLRFEPLVPSTAQRVEFSSTSRVMFMGASKSYVVGLALPATAGSNWTLAVRSDVLGGALSANTTLCPSVMILNERHEQMSFADVPVTTRDTLLGPSQFSGMLPIPASARYIVVFTSRAFGGSSSTFAPMSPGYTALVSGSPGWGRPVGSAVGSLPCSPIGKLTITLSR